MAWGFPSVRGGLSFAMVMGGFCPSTTTMCLYVDLRIFILFF